VALRTVAGLLLVALSGAACGDETGPPSGHLTVAKVSPATTDNQIGTVGRPLSTDLEVLVTLDGNPKVGVPVNWSTTDGGVVGHGPADSQGHATATWTLSTTVGQQWASARVSGGNGVDFFAVANFPRILVTMVSPGTTDHQRGTVGQPLATDLEVLVTEEGSPKIGVAVNWSTTDGGIVGHGPSDAQGHATATWTLSTRVGQQHAAASVSGGNVIGFLADGDNDVAADLIHSGGNDGDNQSGETNSVLSNRLRVLVVDQYGNGVDGVQVSWSVLSEPGTGTTLSPSQSTSDQIGEASTEVTLGNPAGQVVVRAMATIGASPAAEDFTLTAILVDLAFVSYRDRNAEIYIRDAVGGTEIRLTNNTAFDVHPRWSPNGKKIAFVSNRDQAYEIYVMNVDGSGQTRLTNIPVHIDPPVWSPDGQKIAFVSGQGIYLINPDGSALTQLSGGADRDPQWSPDGHKIAFSSYRNGSSEIYLMNADGSGQTRLTNNPTSDIAPVWSPDGQKIAFVRDLELYLMNPDGSGESRLATGAKLSAHDPDCRPAWSPDSRNIAFVRGDGCDWVGAEICLANVDGSQFTCPTEYYNTTTNRSPDWSRRGIAFVSMRQGKEEIYMMNGDGSGQVPLTHGGAWRSPRWRP